MKRLIPYITVFLGAEGLLLGAETPQAFRTRSETAMRQAAAGKRVVPCGLMERTAGRRSRSSFSQVKLKKCVVRPDRAHTHHFPAQTKLHLYLRPRTPTEGDGGKRYYKKDIIHREH